MDGAKLHVENSSRCAVGSQISLKALFALMASSACCMHGYWYTLVRLIKQSAICTILRMHQVRSTPYALVLPPFVVIKRLSSIFPNRRCRFCQQLNFRYALIYY